MPLTERIKMNKLDYELEGLAIALGSPLAKSDTLNTNEGQQEPPMSPEAQLRDQMRRFNLLYWLANRGTKAQYEERVEKKEWLDD